MIYASMFFLNNTGVQIIIIKIRGSNKDPGHIGYRWYRGFQQKPPKFKSQKISFSQITFDPPVRFE